MRLDTPHAESISGVCFQVFPFNCLLADAGIQKKRLVRQESRDAVEAAQGKRSLFQPQLRRVRRNRGRVPVAEVPTQRRELAHLQRSSPHSCRFRHAA